MQKCEAPLAGIRVLDIATFVAAPFAAAALGEFGAEVIKIEQPGVGDSLRRLGTYSDAGDTYWWLSDARNKKCITLDFHKPAGVDLFKRLVAQSDVVVENFRPGTLEKWGIGYEDLKAVNEGLIMLRVSGYGQTGPKKHEPGFARVAHAFSGLTYLVGTPDTPPLAPGSNTLADFLSGTYGAYGILLALRVRDKSGKGQVVDIGLYEPMFRYLDEMAPVYQKTGYVKERVGTGGGHAVPHNHYPTGDGKWVAIACTNDKMFARFAQVMGRPELAGEDMYGLQDKRRAAQQEVEVLVNDWTKSQTQAELLEKCTAGAVPSGPINSIADIFADPQFAARENLLTVEDERVGPLTVANVVPRLSATPGQVRHLGRALGADNAQVLAELLEIGEAELAELKKEGVV
ncbi:MAG: CoA transferase [SAR324 cluster bacterium]|nr:CoA transferase [SAR324 cluster bacterium]